MGLVKGSCATFRSGRVDERRSVYLFVAMLDVLMEAKRRGASVVDVGGVRWVTCLCGNLLRRGSGVGKLGVK